MIAESKGFFREKTRIEVDFAICGTPARSSKISNPLAKSANAVIAPVISTETGAEKRRVKIPTMPNSCMPAPAGVIGTKPNAVTSGCIRKYPIQCIWIIPKDKPKKYHSKPFSIQHAIVRSAISGIARRVL